MPELRALDVLEAAPDPVVVSDVDGRILLVNPRAERVLGRTSSAIIGKPLDLLLPEHLRPRLHDLRRRVISDLHARRASGRPRTAVPRGFEGLVRHKERCDVPVEITLLALQSGERELVVMACHDISGRRWLEAATRHLAAIVEQSGDAILANDIDGVITEWNHGAERLYGYAAEEAIGQPIGLIVPSERHEEELQILTRILSGEEVENFETVRQCKDGSRIDVLAMINPLRDERGEIVGASSIARDISARKRSEKLFRDLLESAPNAMVIVDDNDAIRLVNAQAEAIFGYPRDELIGRRFEMLLPDSRRELQRIRHVASISGEKPKPLTAEREFAAVRKDGSEFPAEISLSPLQTGSSILISAAIRDATERRQARRELEHRAMHDPLTDLPNRRLFIDRLEQALVRNIRPRSRIAVLLIDLDNFKEINDTVGHGAGDELLVALTPRLREVVRPGDTLARLGGDEFAVLCEGMSSEAGAVKVAERIAEALQEPIAIGFNEYILSASIGIVVVDRGTVAADDVLRDADAAMYRAKALGRHRYEIYDEDMRARLLERVATERRLRIAIEDRDFRLLYQPVVSLKDERIVAAEALVRWQQPDGQLLSPAAFITIAEESGLIVPLGNWVIEEALRQSALWHTQFPDLTVSLNLSPRQVVQAGLVPVIKKALRNTGADPTRLDLEITESALIDLADTTLETLSAIRGLGISLVLDDFGTGYSSLSYLKRFPIDAIKIDRSFVAMVDCDPEDAAIVDALITMARALNIAVVAEGVERPEQVASLRASGCRLAQGYYYAPPLSAEELTERLSLSQPLVTRAG